MICYSIDGELVPQWTLSITCLVRRRSCSLVFDWIGFRCRNRPILHKEAWYFGCEQREISRLLRRRHDQPNLIDKSVVFYGGKKVGIAAGMTTLEDRSVPECRNMDIDMRTTEIYPLDLRETQKHLKCLYKYVVNNVDMGRNSISGTDLVP